MNENIPTASSAGQLGHSLKRLDREVLDEEELQGVVQAQEQLGSYECKINEHLRGQVGEGAYTVA